MLFLTGIVKHTPYAGFAAQCFERQRYVFENAKRRARDEAIPAPVCQGLKQVLEEPARRPLAMWRQEQEQEQDSQISSVSEKHFRLVPWV